MVSDRGKACIDRMGHDSNQWKRKAVSKGCKPDVVAACHEPWSLWVHGSKGLEQHCVHMCSKRSCAWLICCADHCLVSWRQFCCMSSAAIWDMHKHCIIVMMTDGHAETLCCTSNLYGTQTKLFKQSQKTSSHFALKGMPLCCTAWPWLLTLSLMH